jgi:hypothetical protein
MEASAAYLRALVLDPSLEDAAKELVNFGGIEQRLLQFFARSQSNS